MTILVDTPSAASLKPSRDVEYAVQKREYDAQVRRAPAGASYEPVPENFQSDVAALSAGEQGFAWRTPVPYLTLSEILPQKNRLDSRQTTDEQVTISAQQTALSQAEPSMLDDADLIEWP